MTDPLSTNVAADRSDVLPPGPTPAPVLSLGRTIAVLAALMVGLLLGALDNFIVATALPNIAQQLHDTAGQVFVVTSYLVAQTVAIPIFGKLSDRYGRRSFYLLGLVIFLAGSTLSGLSQSLNQLILFRALQGLGSGAFFTVVFSLVADMFPPKAAAKLVGILSGVFGIAIVAGPLIGSYIVDHASWRWLFFVNLPIGFTAIVLVLTTIRSVKPAPSPVAFDTAGATLMSAWVGALIFALVETSHGWAWSDPRIIGLLVAAVGLFFVFLWQESRTGDPLIPLRLFRKRLVAMASGVNFLRGAILTAVVTFVPILIVFGLGGTTDVSRDVLYAFLLPLIFGAALGGILTTKVGYRTPVVLGLFLTTLGCLLLVAVPISPPIYRFAAGFIPLGLAGALIPLGFGIGVTFAPTQLAIQYSVAAKDVGTGNGLVWFIGNLGGAIVVSLLATFQQTEFTALLPSFTPGMTLLQFQTLTLAAVATSIRDVWWVLVPLALAGLAFAFFVVGRLPATAPLTEEAAAAPQPVSVL
jgi:EmrB/QacA subfamily drug resistance transporter